MSASTMKAKGEKTRAKIMKELGKRKGARHPSAIATALDISTAYVSTVLMKAAKAGEVERVKEGRAIHYKAKAGLLPLPQVGKAPRLSDLTGP